MNQEFGEVPGAVTMTFMLMANKLEKISYAEYPADRRKADEKGYTLYRMRVEPFTVCAVFGCVDGKQDENGDILAQGLPQDEITGGANTVYVGPTADFMSITTHSRGTNSSWYRIDIEQIVKRMNMYSGEPISISANSADAIDQIKPGQIIITDISTPGGIMRFKHAGSDPKWPVIAGGGGSPAASITGGSHVIMSGYSPLGSTVYTNSWSASAYNNVDLKGGYIQLYVNIASIEVAVGDKPAPFSQNRLIKFQWG
jgi:hypothetical protein